MVTVAEDRHSSLNDGATMAPRIFTKTNIPVLCAGRCSPVDTMGQAGPGDETEQSVLSGSEAEERGTDPVGPVGPKYPGLMDRPVGNSINKAIMSVLGNVHPIKIENVDIFFVTSFLCSLELLYY